MNIAFWVFLAAVNAAMTLQNRRTFSEAVEAEEYRLANAFLVLTFVHLIMFAASIHQLAVAL